ncbi:MAG: DUF4191 domain-containing protein [Frankiaceae bacterium]|nr:DUF4191 domain-containing protein [Frankiaceae bacterium]MBV9871944.1 DUF4191 domain-containing protein [Frankiaceae bacterium]
MARSSKSPAKATKAPPSKAAAGGASAEPPKGRLAQIRTVFTMTRQQDPKALPLIFGPAVGVLAIFVVLGIVLKHPIYFSVIGVLLAAFTGMTIFGRRATRTMYAQVEGRTGAAAAVLQGMRGDWRVTPAVGFTRNEDLVHRVIGKPGIVLVGEGNSVQAIRSLMVDQKKRIGRVAPDTPLHEVLVGDGEGMVSIRKLQTTMMRLPRTLKQKDINAVEARMRALGGPNMPIPKGPMPTRVPRGKIR